MERSLRSVIQVPPAGRNDDYGRKSDNTSQAVDAAEHTLQVWTLAILVVLEVASVARMERSLRSAIRVPPRLLNLSETVPALFGTSAPFSKALKVTCIGGKSWMKVA